MEVIVVFLWLWALGLMVLYSLSMTNVDRILAEAMKLSDEERATLADRLLEIVPEVPDAAVEQVWLKETLRRRVEWKAGRAKAVPVEEALAQMFAKP